MSFQDNKITVFPGWPGYSPDLNPQENVWAEAEILLRQKEKSSDTFAQFQNHVLKSVAAYPHSNKLVGSMAKRMKLLVKEKGQNIGK